MIYYITNFHNSPNTMKASKKSHTATDFPICEPQLMPKAQVKVGNSIHDSLICQQQQISRKKMWVK